MTFKEFTAWCNEQACDGWWGMVEAMVCIDLMAEIRKLSFWKREKFWRELYEKRILDEIVEPINQKIIIDQLAARIPHTDQATTVHTSRVVEVFEFFCIGNLGGDVGILLLKLFQFRSPCRPGAIRNEVIVHFVIDDAVNENLSPPAVKQLCDVFPVHDSWGSPPTALWPNRQTCPR